MRNTLHYEGVTYKFEPPLYSNQSNLLEALTDNAITEQGDDPTDSLLRPFIFDQIHTLFECLDDAVDARVIALEGLTHRHVSVVE